VKSQGRTPPLQVDMSSKQQDCISALDRDFGPVVSCRDFDFTLSFEQSIFEIGVSSLFLVVLPFCLWIRLQIPRELISTPFFSVKVVGTRVECTAWLLTYIFHQVLSILGAALRLACLVLWSKNPATAFSIAGSSVTLVISIGIVFLLLIEQKRLVKPSSFISLYLLCRIAADFVQFRTLRLRGYANTISWLILAEIVVQAVFLFLESWPKGRNANDSKECSPEDTAGVFNRSTLWWLNSLFWLGNGAILKQSDLFSLNASIRSSRLRDRIGPIWEKSMDLESLDHLYTNLCRQTPKTCACEDNTFFSACPMASNNSATSLYDRIPVLTNILAE
jgi:ATP-binding cassette, subfamily C (CFTR/MRP), member 1